MDMPDTDPTLVQNWNITTLKAYFEQRHTANIVETNLKFEAVNLKFEARDVALKLQFEQNQDRFKELNNEAARILKATEVTVSRDVWNNFQENFLAWKTGVERQIQEATTRNEFQTYKQNTDKALTTAAAQAEIQATSKARVAMFIGAAAAMVSVANIVWNIVK